MRLGMTLGVSALILASCGSAEQETATEPVATVSAEETFMTQLIEAKPGDVITLPEGTLSFNRGLSLAVDGVTIRGAGMDKTILDFSGQIAGAEGLLVTASDFLIEDLAIMDTKGDALKVTEGSNITIRNIKTAWSGDPRTENGAYGVYPVQTTNVLMEGIVAYGASDAGIYVGQSKDVIVRNSLAEFNVAGIEVENTINADVYGNVARNNTGGILVFNMPALQQTGYGTRVYNNDVYENNTPNFGHPGTPVASVVAGSGVVVNSNDGVEIFENTLRDNKTAHVIISSLFSTGYQGGDQASDFDPFPESIFIYDNAYTGGGDAPGMPELAALKTAVFGPDGSFPSVVWDGFIDPSKFVDGALPADKKICVAGEGAMVLNVDGPNGFTSPSVDQGMFQCTLEKLPAVDLGRDQ